MNDKLKYIGYSIVFEEVPDEVSLAFNISGCTHHCHNCHSKYLWQYDGRYLSDDLQRIVDDYKNLITCVCLMGGDQNWGELLKSIEIIHMNGLKTAIYVGSELDDVPMDIQQAVDYIKIGPYIESLGGLDHPTTNQRMYRRESQELNDITSRFWRTNE